MADKRRALTAPMTLLRTLLAGSSAFRTWCGAADNDAALARVYRVAVTLPDAKRPFACVGVPVSVVREIDVGDSGEPLMAELEVDVLLEQDATSGQVASAATSGDEWPVYEPFAQAVDDIVQEVEEAGRHVSGSFWCVTGSEVVLPPERAPVDDEATLGRRLWCLVRFRVGVA